MEENKKPFTMNGYELSRAWFDWCFENPEKVKPTHTALYFFCIEHCNRLGWKRKFGLPTEMAKEAIGIKSYNTYISTLNDLVEFGFIILVKKSSNQFSSNIIALSNFNKAPDKALDKATQKHMSKQHESTDSINKPITINNITVEEEERSEQEILDYFDVDVGLKMNWKQKGLPPEKFTLGISLWFWQNVGKKYKDILDLRQHFLFWMPNFYKASQEAKQENNANSNSANNTGRKLSKHEAGLAGALNDLEADLKQRGIQDL